MSKSLREDIITANILNEKANVLMIDENNQEQCINLYDECISIKSRILGSTHEEVITGKNNLAVMSINLHLEEKALVFFRDVLEAKEQMLGKDHEKVADVHQSIGLIYKNLQNQELAIYHLQECLTIRKSKLEIDNSKIYDTIYNLGICLAMQKKFQQALIYFEEANSGYGICGHESCSSVVLNVDKWIDFVRNKSQSKLRKVKSTMF